MRRRGAARKPRSVLRNPKPAEALRPGRRKQAAPNIHVMRFRCGEPRAKLRRVFFMRQAPAFSRRTRDGEGCRGRHGLAEMLPRICHAAVRLDSYAALSRVRRVGRGIDANASGAVPTIRPCIWIWRATAQGRLCAPYLQPSQQRITRCSVGSAEVQGENL